MSRKRTRQGRTQIPSQACASSFTYMNRFRFAILISYHVLARAINFIMRVGIRKAQVAGSGV